MEHRLQPVAFLQTVEKSVRDDCRGTIRTMQAGRAYRRFLPHYENPEQTYFITFCTLGRRLLNGEARDIILKEVIDRHRVFYYLRTGVVMPDHAHLLLTPMDTSLAEIMKRIKGASAREVNRVLGGSGSIWQREYFDRELRRSDDIRTKGEYIALNPVREGLV